MVAAAMESDRGKPDKPQTSKTLAGSLQLSLYVGLGLGTLLFVFAKQFLSIIMGKPSADIDPAVLGPALDYVRVRAFGVPAAAVLGSAQTAWLAMRDTRSPVFPTIIAAVVTWVANLVLIRPDSGVSGAAGAAFGTVIAQYVALAAALRWIMSGKKPNEKSTAPSSVSTRGFLEGKYNFRSLLRLPSKQTQRGFAPYIIPVTTTQAGRCSASATLDHVVTSSLGTVNMAANQIMTSVFYGLVPLADALSLAAQSFYPGIAAREPGREKANDLARLNKSFLKAAGLCGGFLASVMLSMPFTCRAFSSDPAVIKVVKQLVPIHFTIATMHGLFCGSEGQLLGQKDLKFISGMYGVATFLIPFLLLRLKNQALAGTRRVTLVNVWQIFLGYQIARVSLMASRNFWLQLKACGPRAYSPSRFSLRPHFASSQSC